MIILRFSKDITKKELTRALARLKSTNSDVYLINRDSPDFTDVICDSDAGDDELLKRSGALTVIRSSESYILASRNYQHIAIDILPESNWRRGKTPLIIGGPCSVEDRAQVLEIAHAVRESGADADRKSTRLNSSHIQKSRMPSSA